MEAASWSAEKGLASTTGRPASSKRAMLARLRSSSAIRMKGMPLHSSRPVRMRHRSKPVRGWVSYSLMTSANVVASSCVRVLRRVVDVVTSLMPIL